MVTRPFCSHCLEEESGDSSQDWESGEGNLASRVWSRGLLKHQLLMLGRREWEMQSLPKSWSLTYSIGDTSTGVACRTSRGGLGTRARAPRHGGRSHGPRR
jgi:hypothetical protein